MYSCHTQLDDEQGALGLSCMCKIQNNPRIFQDTITAQFSPSSSAPKSSSASAGVSMRPAMRSKSLCPCGVIRLQDIWIQPQKKPVSCAGSHCPARSLTRLSKILAFGIVTGPMHQSCRMLNAGCLFLHAGWQCLVFGFILQTSSEYCDMISRLIARHVYFIKAKEGSRKERFVKRNVQSSCPSIITMHF